MLLSWHDDTFQYYYSHAGGLFARAGYAKINVEEIERVEAFKLTELATARYGFKILSPSVETGNADFICPDFKTLKVYNFINTSVHKQKFGNRYQTCWLFFEYATANSCAEMAGASHINISIVT